MRSNSGQLGNGCRILSILFVCLMIYGVGGKSVHALSSSLDRDSLKPHYKQLKNGQRPDKSISSQGETTTGKVPTVYLTFDDGPSEHTTQVLDILAREQVPATFFVLGNRVERYPETVARILEEGHSLGNHTYNHQYQELYGHFDVFWEQIVQTEEILHEWTGIRPKLVRAPGGTYTNFDAFYYYYLEEAGYQVVDWNVDSGDSKRRGVPAKEIVSTVKNSILHQEAVVLLHDGTGHKETVKALPEIIQYYRNQGYAFSVLEEDKNPLQFRLGTVKWNRSAVSFEQFSDTVATMKEHRASAAKGPLLTSSISTTVPSNESSPSASDNISEAESSSSPSSASSSFVPLQVTLNGVAWTIAADSYKFDHGRFAVPLAGLAEQLGADVKWEDNDSTALVELNGQRAVFDPLGKTISLTAKDGTETVHQLADLALEDGQLYVGLRIVAEWFGFEIAGYSIGDVKNEVNLQKNLLVSLK